MKTILTLFVLFLSSISFNSYGGWFDKTICFETDAQIRGEIIYLPNETESFTGKNLCKYENGQIKSEGKFKDGIKDDKWNAWHKNGQIDSEINYKDDKKIIETIYSYDENDQIHFVNFYKEGILISETIYSHYENGQTEFKENYKDNKLDGKVTYWFENGEIEHEATFKKSKCVSGDCHKFSCKVKKDFTGIQLCAYENGQIEIKVKIRYGLKQGIYTSWYDNNQIKGKYNYKHGKIEGLYITWYKNGQIFAEANYKDGKLNGLLIFYDEQ